MAITVPEAIIDASGAATSIALNTGTFTPNPNVGDLLVSHFFVGTTGATLTLPSGWTEIVKTENAGDAITSQIAYKVADSSDASGQSLSWSKSGGTAALKIAMIRIAGQRTASAIATSSGQANDSTTTVTAPTVTPFGADSLVLFFAAAGTASTVSAYAIATSSPSFTEMYDNNDNSVNFAGAYGLRPEVTATGSGTATTSVSGPNIGQLVIISAPQTLSITETVTLTDELRYNIGGLYTDSLSVTDSSTFDETSWFNQDKSSSTWDNLEKS